MRHRLLRHPLGRWVDPDAVFDTLCGTATDCVWLDTATGGRSYIGRATRVISTKSMDGSVLEFLRRDLAQTSVAPGGEGFSLGWVGWLGYETRFETMGTPRTRESSLPDAAFLYLDRLVEFDDSRGEVSLLALGEGWDGDLAEWRDATLAALAAPTTPRDPLPQPPVSATWRDTDDEYLAMISACQSAIRAGDAYQLCLTTEVRIDVAPDPVVAYRALRAASPSHHGALLRIGDVSLLSSSPEQFLAVSPSGVVESRPIKGTRPRGATPEADAALAAELVASEKERAENLMIVDLMRNDISRVSEVGTVEVTALLAVESYAQVHQLVSTIRGRLARGMVGMDAVVSCFPAGSMTGAPKYGAVEILDSLEGRPRGIYSGAFGYFGLDGRIDLAMVIRSIIVSPMGTTVGAGGGITILSDPVEELAEAKLKAAALLAVLGAS